jgi:hypothetical protein
MLVFLLAACNGPETDTVGPEETGQVDTAPEVLPHTLGDPMTSRVWREEDGFLAELYLAEAISSDRGLLTGLGELLLYDEDGVIVDRLFAEKVWAVASLEDLVVIGYVGLDSYHVEVFDLVDDALVSRAVREVDARPISLAVEGEHIALVTTEGTVSFLNLDAQSTGSLDVTDAVSVVFDGEGHLLVGHGSEVSMLTRAGEVLSSVQLDSAVRDVDMGGQHVAVARGGEGVDVLRWDGKLSLRGHIDSPTMRVSVDGEDVWLASWHALGLGWLGEGGPVLVGQETPTNVAMDVGAKDGRAWVADWMGVGVVDRHEGLTGPELDLPVSVIGMPGAEAVLRARNTGLMPLDFSIGGQQWTLEPGEQMQTTVPTPESGSATMNWTSSDVDEPSGQLAVHTAELGEGAVQPDFTLAVFDPTVNEATTPWNLASHLDRPVFLVFWAEF